MQERKLRKNVKEKEKSKKTHKNNDEYFSIQLIDELLRFRIAWQM